MSIDERVNDILARARKLDIPAKAKTLGEYLIYYAHHKTDPVTYPLRQEYKAKPGPLDSLPQGANAEVKPEAEMGKGILGLTWVATKQVEISKSVIDQYHTFLGEKDNTAYWRVLFHEQLHRINPHWPEYLVGLIEQFKFSYAYEPVRY